MRTLQKTIAVTSMLCLLSGGVAAQDIRLPDMGSPADAVLPKSEEDRIGRAIMAQIRRSGEVVEDPLVTEYINNIGSKIAAHANDGDHTFSFFVVDNRRINAFALPGGFIGVHTGLLQATRNEDELAGVIGHEIAHVTQRHIARAIHANQRQSLISTAIMLGALVAGAAGAGGDAVQGGIAVAQGTAAQQRINFTRANEYEADRIGIRALADAGFDPHGMASFFEVMSRQAPADLNMRLPEFLRTHPVTTNRIAEARNRARNLPRVDSEDSVDYGIARARSRVASFERSEDAVTYFENRTSVLRETDAERYGRAGRRPRVHSVQYHSGSRRADVRSRRQLLSPYRSARRGCAYVRYRSSSNHHCELLDKRVRGCAPRRCVPSSPGACAGIPVRASPAKSWSGAT